MREAHVSRCTHECMGTPNLSIALERIITARRRLEQFHAHLEVTLSYRKAFGAPARADEIENAVELAAMAVIDTCESARGTDPVVVAAALARLDQACIELESLCRQLALTEASA
jgi:hypothetical protein